MCERGEKREWRGENGFNVRSQFGSFSDAINVSSIVDSTFECKLCWNPCLTSLASEIKLAGIHLTSF